MSLTNIKNERKLIDGIVVLIAASSAYFSGFIQTLDLGPVSITILLPVSFIVFLAFMHLVLRRSRKFDEREHKIAYELIKGLTFTGTVLLSYRTGLSATKTFIPQNTVSSVATIIFLGASMYLMAYRANKN